MSVKSGSEATGVDSVPRLGKVIARLSAQLDTRRIGSGAMAELRRIRDDSLPPQFWMLYLTVVPPEWRERNGKPHYRHDLAWARLTRAMAEMGSRPQKFDLSLGTALRSTGYSEERFVRLLRAEGAALARELRIAASWLARAGVLQVDWMRPAALFRWGPGMRSSPATARHQLSRDYFKVAASQSASYQGG